MPQKNNRVNFQEDDDISLSQHQMYRHVIKINVCKR